jgi:hypothetical protein
MNLKTICENHIVNELKQLPDQLLKPIIGRTRREIEEEIKREVYTEIKNTLPSLVIENLKDYLDAVNYGGERITFEYKNKEVEDVVNAVSNDILDYMMYNNVPSTSLSNPFQGVAGQLMDDTDDYNVIR